MSNSSFAANNTIHKLLDKSSNRILYDPSNSLFDRILVDTELGIYHENSPYVTDYTYDAYISNNFIKHSTGKNSFIQEYHLHDILFIHEALNPNFKKEDRVILNNNLKDTYKILLHDSLSDSWNYFTTKTSIIKYGIQILDIERIKSREDILIINLKKNNQLNLIYQHLKNIFPKTKMLTDVVNDDWKTIYDIISSYKVVIDEGSIFNQIIAAYCGCIVITPHINFDKRIIGYFNINDFGSVFSSMGSILSSYNVNNFNSQIDHIKQEYHFDNFKNQITNLIQTIKQEVFTL
jgi:hypothetical protein